MPYSFLKAMLRPNHKCWSAIATCWDARRIQQWYGCGWLSSKIGYGSLSWKALRMLGILGCRRVLSSSHLPGSRWYRPVHAGNCTQVMSRPLLRCSQWSSPLCLALRSPRVMQRWWHQLWFATGDGFVSHNFSALWRVSFGALHSQRQTLIHQKQHDKLNSCWYLCS